MRRPTILLTGFGPFPNVRANATSHLVPKLGLAARRAFPGMHIEVETLPTEWSGGLDRVAVLHRHLRPAVALHFGVASRARGFEIEARGRNLAHSTVDAVGCLPDGDCLVPEGPEFLASRLPWAETVVRLRRMGLPAYVSRDAGGYLCNAALYTALHLARHSPEPPRVGFIHVPSTLVDESRPERGPHPRCPLDWPGMIAGGLEIIATALGRRART